MSNHARPMYRVWWILAALLLAVGGGVAVLAWWLGFFADLRF